jgi:hypothetical protein
MSLLVVKVHVILSVPVTQVLIQTVEPTLVSAEGGLSHSNYLPVSSSGKICDALHRNVLGDERRNGVTDEHIGLLDLAPQMVPDILLRSPLLVRQVASDLDMGSVHHRSIWSYQFNERDQTRHLRVVNL